MSVYRVVTETLQESLSKVLSDISYVDTQVIFSHENGLEPKNTYCVIEVLGISQVGGRVEATFLTEGDILESIATYKLEVQLSFIGKISEDVGMDFRHSLINNRKCFEVLQRAGLGILKRGDIRRIPQKRETEWVSATNMDIDFSFAVNTRQSYDWIEYIKVNNEVIRIRNGEE